jgi:hypothetical protein
MRMIEERSVGSAGVGKGGSSPPLLFPTICRANLRFPKRDAFWPFLNLHMNDMTQGPPTRHRIAIGMRRKKSIIGAIRQREVPNPAGEHRAPRNSPRGALVAAESVRDDSDRGQRHGHRREQRRDVAENCDRNRHEMMHDGQAEILPH